MSKKISKEEFLSRFYRNYPDGQVELLNYTAISNPLNVRCMKCGRKFSYSRARDCLSNFNCCLTENARKIERLIKIYDTNDEFEFIKQVDKDHFIVHHNKCGNDLIRVIGNSLDNPFACKFCETAKASNMLNISEVQEQINTKFDSIQILDYNGQLEKNHYKCLKCGLIFTQQQTCLMQSRGCPKCDRFKSQGEVKLAKLLKENNIKYSEQVNVSALPLQHFDFAIYNDDNQIAGFIEVQGEQHFEQREIFKDGLAKIQERDQRKRDYCRDNNIPLYELIYKKGKFLNLDILPFSSTTISTKESTP